MRRCIDCGFWFSFYSCRECGKPLCGACVDWPSPRLHSPGKGICEACREKPKVFNPPPTLSRAEIASVIAPITIEQLEADLAEHRARKAQP